MPTQVKEHKHDRNRASTDGTGQHQGSSVSKQVGAKVLDAFAASFKEHLPMRTETFTVEADGVEEEREREVQVTPDELTVEQKAAFFLDRTKAIITRLTNQHIEQLANVQQEADLAALKEARESQQINL